MISEPGMYLTRSGLRVDIHRVNGPGTFSCKGTLIKPSPTGIRSRREYNIWKPDGSFRAIGESNLDIVQKYP